MKYATFNVRGLLTEEKQSTLADDLEKYGVDIAAIQETHRRGTDLIQLKSSGERKFNLFYTGSDTNSYHGVAIAVRENINASYKQKLE